LLTPYALGEVFETKNCEPLFLNPIKTTQIQLSSADELADKISDRRRLVPEFEFIREEAQKRGLRVWLFGGTAAGYCHYVKWDLLRQKGDQRFQANRFDYDYTHIYRSTQDLDIVVNGTANQAAQFEQTLKTRFPYFAGQKATPWEVRSLYETTEDKGGLLDDFGFMNQHTDSNSTGMVELTDPPLGESVVRDLRDWHRSDHSQFLQDITQGTLTFYHSPQHEETPRAKTGKNPPIFSVIRALIKAFQYDLTIKQSDLEILRKEIENFDSMRDLKPGYTGDWIEKHGKKLFQNALDVEKAWNTLESLGLRKKMLSIRNNPNSYESMAWWLSKEPLRQKPIGEGTGRTAGSLGITVVSHETREITAYENITRAHTGIPNVFISRQGTVGESAIYGNGFYTAVGNKGGARTGLTVRFEANPNAREGTDFIRAYREYYENGDLVQDGDFIIWKNRNALRVIPQILDLSPVEYFEFLSQGKAFKTEDRAILLKFKDHLDLKIISGRISFPELEAIRDIIQNTLSSQKTHLDTLFTEWIKLEGNRLRKSKAEIASWMKLWKTKGYAIDPVTFFKMIIEISQDTGLEIYFKKEWIPSLLAQINTDIGDRVLENCLFSQISAIRNFGIRALKNRTDQNPTNFTQALQSIIKHNSNARAWLKTKVDSPDLLRLKAAYLALHPEFRKLLTDAEYSLIEPEILKISFLPIFEKQLNQPLPENIRTESFQFKSFTPDREGTIITVGPQSRDSSQWNSYEDQYQIIVNDPFEMQLTPVTQFQWALIMGNNPSEFLTHKTSLLVHEKPTLVDLNHPVEHLSWLDILAFIQRLNELDPHYHYRLPTEAEWEFVLKIEKQIPSPHLNDPLFYSWTMENSEGEIHDVASLKPDKYGLYDFLGNIWEWVDKSTGPTVKYIHSGINTQIQDSKFNSLLRGGSCTMRLMDAPVARRFNYPEDQIRSFSGFRLVRTPNTNL